MMKCYMHRWMDGWMDGWMEGWMNGWTRQQIDKQADNHMYHKLVFKTSIYQKYRYTYNDILTDRNVLTI